MKKLPFSAPGSFFKGNLHCHSTRSDGHLTPEKICDLYRREGYDFISLTEHFLEQYNYPITDTTAFRTDNFTTLSGAELHGDSLHNGNPWHIVAVGLPQDFAPIPLDTPVKEILARANKAGAFTVLAHPGWYGLSEDDVANAGYFDAIEIFNGGCADDNDSAENAYFIDVLLGKGMDFSLLAVDDAHIPGDKIDYNLGWVMVKAENNNSREILEALKNGSFYSSTGPLIHDVRIEGDEIIVVCSPAERVFLTGVRPEASVTADLGGVREARLRIKNITSDWARVTVRDRMGKKAWTNPFKIR